MNAETYLSRILMKEAGLSAEQSFRIAKAIVSGQKIRSICEGKEDATPAGG
jgi:hypothetical protein